jgi:hypothetical protein
MKRINYRKIYEKHYGPIPKEANGRAYEIHHIDGNHSNNDPLNLTAITLQEHYDIHFLQGDWAACYFMSIQRMHKTPDELSALSSSIQLERVQNGTHHFLNGDISRNSNRDRVKNKTHHFLKRADGTSVALDRAKNKKLPIQLATLDGKNPWQRRDDGTSFQQDLVKLGKHPLLGGEIQRKQLATGAHASQIKVSCLFCKNTISKNAYAQHHGDNCKHRE